MSTSPYSTWLMRLLWLIDLYAVMTSSSQCVFPPYMTRMSYWNSHVTEENRQIGALWNFTDHSVAQLTDLRVGARTTTYFICREVIDHETVLTGVSSDGATNTVEYQCLRFIQRSDFVVQLARSAVFRTGSPNRCLQSEQFVLEASVLVQPSMTATTSSDQRSCGLVGGYWLSVVYPSGMLTCRDAFLRPIIEADCASPGEGVLIDFRQRTCAVPSISGSITLHRMVCLGSWTQSGFVFTVLSDNKIWPKLWMLKIPEGAPEPITARFLTSLSTSPAHNTTAYDVRLTPASFPTLCENEATGCDVTTHCVDDSAEVHCQKECSACAVATGGSSCQFSDTELGHWLQMSRRFSAGDNDASRVVTVTVTNKTVQVGSQPAWRCIEFATQSRYSSAAAAGRTRRPVAMVFEEAGCRPRLACMEVIRRSEVVIQYRIGRKVTWPDDAENVCSDAMFTDQDVPDSQYQALVHRDKSDSSAVACGIDAWYHLNGSNSAGQQFEGYVDACGPDVTAFRYVTVASSPTSDDKLVTSQQTHRCLATFTVPSSIPGAVFTYIITASRAPDPAEPPQFFCWLQVRSPLQKNLHLHLSFAADCRHSPTGIQLSLDESSSSYIAHFDLISSDSKEGWIRNCSSRHLVPIITPGPTTPGLGAGSTTVPTTTSGTHSSLAISFTAAAAAAAVSVAWIINLLYTAR